MAKKAPLLERMEANPADDWTIADVEKLCAEVGLRLASPSNGSHFKVHSERLPGVLTIPAKRPIRPVYIRYLVSLANAHIAQAKSKKKGKSR